MLLTRHLLRGTLGLICFYLLFATTAGEQSPKLHPGG